MPKTISLPDGSEIDFPDEMDDDAISSVLSKQFPSNQPPKSLMSQPSWQLPQVGNVDQLAQFQKEQEGREPQPPSMLARDPSLGQTDAPDPMARFGPGPDNLPARTPEQWANSPNQPEGDDPQRLPTRSELLAAATAPGVGGGAKALGTGIAGLRGLSGASKVRQVASATGTVAKTGAIFYAADKALETVGVPAGAREAILIAAGFTPPGRSMARSVAQAVRGVVRPGEAAVVTGSERYAAKIAAAKAEEAARKAATEALGVGKATPKVLSEAEKAAASARPWEAPKPNWAGMADEAAEETRAIATPPSAPSLDLKAANEARAARLAAFDKEQAIKEAMAPVRAEPMAASEERLYNAAEAKAARDAIKVEQDYLKATELAAKKAATQRAVGDGVKRSSVPKTDNVIEGDFIDPQYVSVAPEPSLPPVGQRAMATNLGGSARPGPAPTAPQDLEEALRQTLESAKSTGTLKAPTVPANYESTAAQTRSVEALRKEVGAVKAARKLGIPKDQVNQVRLDAGDRGSEALGEAAGLPEGARRAIVSKLSSLKSREEVMAYIRRANNDKARLQIEGIAVGMGLL